MSERPTRARTASVDRLGSLCPSAGLVPPPALSRVSWACRPGQPACPDRRACPDRPVRPSGPVRTGPFGRAGLFGWAFPDRRARPNRRARPTSLSVRVVWDGGGGKRKGRRETDGRTERRRGWRKRGGRRDVGRDVYVRVFFMHSRRACVFACVRACARACLRAYMHPRRALVGLGAGLFFIASATTAATRSAVGLG